MKKLLIIPELDSIEEDLELVDKYNLGFEYNDFFNPYILDSDKRINELKEKYNSYKIPKYTTMHGAFFDVIPFSMDDKIREVSTLRIEQSIEVGKIMGAKAIVFHTNYNPFLNDKVYIRKWIEGNTIFWNYILSKYSDINIYLENMFEISPDIMEELAGNLYQNKNFGVCFDYAHAALSRTDLKEWAKKLGKYVKHVHINDNDQVSDLHLAWGKGIIDRNEFYKCYDKYMTDATILLETRSIENKINSIKQLKEDGFID